MSQRVFVSCSLWEQDRDVTNFFRDLLLASGIIPRTVGIDVQASTDQEAAALAKKEIMNASGVVVILTRRYYVDGYKSSEWTYEEPSMGYYGNKPLYIFYERGIQLKGVSASTACMKVEFDRAYLSDEQEISRLKEWMTWIKSNLQSRNVGNMLAAICAVAGALFAIYGFVKFLEAVFKE